MIAESTIIQAAKQLRQASESGQTCAPIRELIGMEDIEAAYAIQKINNQLRIDAGARIIGSKVGLTSLVVQQQFGVYQPDFGMLFHDKEVLNGGEISIKEILQPKVEAEVAFVLGKDLTEENLTSIDILSAIEYALVSIEIVGSRVEGWNIKITDTVADNASASHYVVGHRPMCLGALDLTGCKMQMTKNGVIASEGTGAACLGSPINAVLWLAQTMAKIGSPMRAGDLILSGAVGPMVGVAAGDHIEASIEGLGSVSVRFTD